MGGGGGGGNTALKKIYFPPPLDMINLSGTRKIWNVIENCISCKFIFIDFIRIFFFHAFEKPKFSIISHFVKAFM